MGCGLCVRGAMFVTLLPTKLIRKKMNIDISIPANALFSNMFILAVLFFFTLFYSGNGHASFCLFKTLTGIPCPACGTTRAVMCLLAGNISDAFLYNPCAILLVLIIAVQIPVQVMTLKKKFSLELMLRTSKMLTYVFVSGLVITWLLRLFFTGFLKEL
jgi:hypothetical protein